MTAWTRDGRPMWSDKVDGLSWLGFDPRTSALATQQFVRPPGDDETGVQLWTATGARDRVIATGAVSPVAWSSGAMVYGANDKLVVRAPSGSTVELDVNATTAAASPSGALVAVSEGGGRPSIWDARTREPLAVALDESGTATALAWSPDGGMVAAAASDTVRLWDVAEFSKPELSVGPDGKNFVVYAHGESEAFVFDAATGKRTAKISLPSLFSHGEGSSGHFTVQVLGPSLQISSKPCAGPCVQTVLATLAGKRIAWVGGVPPGDGDGFTGTQVRGDVWVFEDGSSKLTYQDVRTAASSATRTAPPIASEVGASAAPSSSSAPTSAPRSCRPKQGAGDVTVPDERGVTVGRHRLPICK